jgi:hypothetical protein
MEIEEIEKAWDWWKKLDEMTQNNISFSNIGKEPYQMSLSDLVNLYTIVIDNQHS